MKTQSILKTALIAASFSAFTLIGSAQAAPVINVEWTQLTTDANLNGTAYSSSVAPLSYAGTTWNAIQFNYGTVDSSLLTSTGASTSVGYSMSYGYNSWNSQDPSNPLFDTGGLLGGTSTLTITGLTSGLTYNLAIVSDEGNFRGGVFTISGYGTQTTTPTQFTPFVLDNQYVEFTGVAPISGDITVSISGVNGDTLYPVSGFQLEAVPAVPEPSTYALMGLGALALLVVSRRRRTA